jgi:hypothetical protein
MTTALLAVTLKLPILTGEIMLVTHICYIMVRAVE